MAETVAFMALPPRLVAKKLENFWDRKTIPKIFPAGRAEFEFAGQGKANDIANTRIILVGQRPYLLTVILLTPLRNRPEATLF